MCFGGGTPAPNNNVNPAPYSVDNSQSAVKYTATPATDSTLKPSAVDPTAKPPVAAPTTSSGSGLAM